MGTPPGVRPILRSEAMEELEERRPREALDDLRWLPIRHGRWRARRVVAAVSLGLFTVGIFTGLPPGPRDEYGVPALVVGVLGYLLYLQRSRQLLVRLAVTPRHDVPLALHRIEQLVGRTRLDPQLRACLVACVAELEVKEGDLQRGLRLVSGLWARGWSPIHLLDASAGGHDVLVIRAAATMATLCALRGDLGSAEAALPRLRSVHAGTPADLLGAVVHLRRGDAVAAADLLDPSRTQRQDSRQEILARRVLGAFARAQLAPSPYRTPALPPEASGPSIRWLTQGWSELREFVEPSAKRQEAGPI